MYGCIEGLTKARAVSKPTGSNGPEKTFLDIKTASLQSSLPFLVSFGPF